MKPHLILDEQSVAASSGVAFHLNPATKHPENPVLLPGEPHQWDSLHACWPGTVLYSPRDRKFRCWYAGMDVVQTPTRAWYYGYAESDDGIHWRKPDLGQVEFLGKPTNQVRPPWIAKEGEPEHVWGKYMLSLVFENPLPDAPAGERFGAYWIEHTKSGGHKALAWSPDGTHWKRHSTAYTLENYRRVNFQDISQLVYDPDDPDLDFRVKGYTQILRPRAWDPRKEASQVSVEKGGRELAEFSALKEVRQIGLVHGKDFAKVVDAPNPIVLGPEQGIDEELHFAAVKKIGGTFVMLFESDRFSRNPLHGDLRLAVSDDGRKFRRVHKHTPLVSTGPKGMWDENILVTTTSAMQEVGDEIWIYYFGAPNVWRHWPPQYAVDPTRRGSLYFPSYLGLATLPRDRFAYASGPGTVTTHSTEMSTEGLWLNADGDPQVSAFDEAGTLMVRGTLDRERRQTVYRKVVWADAPPRGRCRFQITLRDNERIFSVNC